MKKRYILFACLFFITAAVLLVGALCSRTDREVQQEEVESLRDQLKVFQTDTTESLPEADAAEQETEESWIQETVAEDSPAVDETEEVPAETEPIPVETDPVETTETTLPETEKQKVPVSSLDFQSMWKINPDICAWIEIEGTKVDYPVLQSPTDDEKYLTTAMDGSYYIGGSIFTQATYNNRDFNDPVTLIYGHTMRSGTLFGQLQSTYTSASGFSECSEIKLYLPEEVRTYTVFAAVPYSNIHIPATYDFSKEYWFDNFFDSIFRIRELGVQFNRDIEPEYGDRVIILSTCMNEDSTKRYLVMAICQDDIG